MRTNAIAHFKIRIQVRNNQRIQIQTLIQHVLGILFQMTKQQKRSFIRKMSADIFARRVVPTSVEQLEHSSDFIIPPDRKIGTRQIGKVHKIEFLLVRKSSPT